MLFMSAVFWTIVSHVCYEIWLRKYGKRNHVMVLTYPVHVLAAVVEGAIVGISSHMI